MTLPFSSFVHHRSGPITCALTQTTLKITECTHTQTHIHMCIYIHIQVIMNHQEHKTKVEGKGGASVLCDVMQRGSVWYSFCFSFPVLLSHPLKNQHIM